MTAYSTFKLVSFANRSEEIMWSLMRIVSMIIQFIEIFAIHLHYTQVACGISIKYVKDYATYFTWASNNVSKSLWYGKVMLNITLIKQVKFIPVEQMKKICIYKVTS